MRISPGAGAMPEDDGRNFMALLDMCHFLVDQITQEHEFADVQAASNLRATNTAKSALLTAQMYSYWHSAPAGPGVFEMLLEWTKDQQNNENTFAGRAAREVGRRAQALKGPGAALFALARNECAQWPRRRLTGAFYFAGEDAGGAALLADEALEKVYRVVGISTSLGNLMRANGREPVGAALALTLLPWLGGITYDGTLRGAPPTAAQSEPSFAPSLQALAAKAQADGRVVKELPTVADAPFLAACASR